MKPLNNKERNEYFISFILAAISTLLLVIFCFYFTNALLQTGLADERVNQYKRFQFFKRNQKLYVKDLENIEKTFKSSDPDFKMLSKFIDRYEKCGDTTLLMKKIDKLLRKEIIRIDLKKIIQKEEYNKKIELEKCQADINKNYPN